MKSLESFNLSIYDSIWCIQQIVVQAALFTDY